MIPKWLVDAWGDANAAHDADDIAVALYHHEIEKEHENDYLRMQGRDITPRSAA